MFAWIIEDNHCPAIPAWEPLYEVDFHGRRATGHPSRPCKNNPAYRGFLLNLVEDYLRSYDLDGIMWGAERQSGFLNTLGIGDPGRGTCFCEFCVRKARDSGIDVERARRGFAEIEKFRLASAARRPRDGTFVSFWRILLSYPELLAWEALWVRSRHELQAEIYAKAKSIKPSAPVGWHIWQNVTFSPLQRAEEDYAVLSGFSDFVRPAVYNNCAGERFHAFAKSSLAGVFGDLQPAQTYDLLQRLSTTARPPTTRCPPPAFRPTTSCGRPGGGRRRGRDLDPGVARNRHRRAGPSGNEPVHAGGNPGGGPGGLPGRGRRCHPVPELRRDGPRPPVGGRGRPAGARSRLGAAAG